MRLGEILVAHQAMSEDDVCAALEGREDGERLGEAAVRLGLASWRDVARALAEQSGVPLLDASALEPDPQIGHLVPLPFLFRTELFPLRKHEGKLVVATHDPYALEAFNELCLIVGLDVEPRLAPRDELREAIRKAYGLGADSLDRAAREGRGLSGAETAREQDVDAKEDAALIQFVNQVFSEAISARASDIHIEPEERDLAIRYRIDGVLHPARMPKEIKRFQAAIISRLKIMANLDIAEKRLPQDGRIKIQSGGKEYDVRVSLLPLLHGEGAELRILRQDGGGKSLAEIGMAEESIRRFRELIALPHGIVLVTGPTGSGKTTTLYAGLREIDVEHRKVITIEDPVEYRLRGVSQIQIREKIGLDFARGLRSILRHDPNVIMVGEIRDRETSEIAVQAALTGHLVFSTLHTNDAVTAVTRLVDIGVERYLVASTLEGLIAQRLVRRVCVGCAERRTVRELGPRERKVAQSLGLADDQVTAQGRGCDLCRGTGYFDRVGIFEFITLDDGFRELVQRTTSTVELRRYARARGFQSLREDGIRLVREGVTTPEEVLRVTRDSRG